MMSHVRKQVGHVAQMVETENTNRVLVTPQERRDLMQATGPARRKILRYTIKSIYSKLVHSKALII